MAKNFYNQSTARLISNLSQTGNVMNRKKTFTRRPSLPDTASAEEKEAFYAEGYALYNQNKYTEALPFFAILSQRDPTTAKYRVALAACQKMTKQYDKATSNYAMAFLLERNQLELILNIVECQIEAYHVQNALDILAQLSTVKMPPSLQQIMFALQTRALSLRAKH
jgi:thioredoxin-like negative regulator of GroEL